MNYYPSYQNRKLYFDTNDPILVTIPSNCLYQRWQELLCVFPPVDVPPLSLILTMNSIV